MAVVACMGVDALLVIPTDLFVWSVKCVCSVSTCVSKFSRNVSRMEWNWMPHVRCNGTSVCRPVRFIKTATLSDGSSCSRFYICMSCIIFKASLLIIDFFY